ncbi:hypothetical protein INR49_031567 [Caranx melampygus]|nr:hypothetical protein INR49_031567 [Caranx melampygus]
MHMSEKLHLHTCHRDLQMLLLLDPLTQVTLELTGESDLHVFQTQREKLLEGALLILLLMYSRPQGNK